MIRPVRLALAALATTVVSACADAAPPTAPESLDLPAAEARVPTGPPAIPGRIVTGPASGGAAVVKTFDGQTAQELSSFFAFPPAFTGGVHVAAGDVSGDGVADIVTGAGPGGGPHVKVFDGASGQEVRSFFAYAASFQGGVNVASGDVNGDGVADIVTGAGPGGGPHVKVFDGAGGGELASFFAYAASFQGGVNVASGDVNGDGVADIVTGAGPGGGPHVKVFDGASGREIRSFFAYAASFRGGVNVASGDVNGDGVADIVTGAGPGGGPHVKVFDGAGGGELASFFAYAASFQGGVNVASGDVNGDGVADIVTGAGAGGGPHVKLFDGRSGAEAASFFAYAPTFTGGVSVAAVGPEGVPTPGIAELIEAVDRAVRDGTLTGAGPGRSASGRLKAWRAMLAEALALEAAGDLEEACGQLRQVLLRVDGRRPPPDFVQGPAAADLQRLVVLAMHGLGC